MVLVEKEAEITIREVVEDMEVKEIPLLVLEVTILIQMEVSIAICLNLIRVASPDLQGFKVRLNDHNIRFVEIMDIWFWIATTRWILPFKASILHQNLLPW